MSHSTFETVCKIAAAVICVNDGQSIKSIAVSAEVHPSTVRRWLKKGGFIRINGKYRHV